MPAKDETEHLAEVSWREGYEREILVMGEMLRWKIHNICLAKSRQSRGLRPLSATSPFQMKSHYLLCVAKSWDMQEN